MIDGQLLPCLISERSNEMHSIQLSLENKAGFFYLDSRHIDLWVTDKHEVMASHLFEQIQKASFSIIIQTVEGESITKKVTLKPLQYAYIHPNEKMKDQLRDSRFYQGIRLSFENDFQHLEIKQVQLRISKLTLAVDKKKLAQSIQINYLPLINYQVNFANPIQLDGMRDSYPLLSETGDNLSLLKIFTTKVMKESGEVARIYPSVVSHSKELSYDLIRPCYERKIKHAHIMVNNYVYGEDNTLQVSAAWFDRRGQIGKLAEFNFISKPVESINIDLVHYSESCGEMTIDMNMLHSVQNLTYQSNLTTSDLMSLYYLIVSEQVVQDKLKFLLEYWQKNLEINYDSGQEYSLNIVEDAIQNQYFNKVFQGFLDYHQALVSR